LSESLWMLLHRWKNFAIVFLAIALFRLPYLMAFGGISVLMNFLWTDIYFLADGLVALNTAYTQKGTLVMDRKLIARRCVNESMEGFRFALRGPR
jgi:hypothetical protein